MKQPIRRLTMAVAVWLQVAFVSLLSAAEPIRFATFNASLNRGREGQLIEDLTGRDNGQARQIAEIIQRIRPDVLLINEFDYDDKGRAATLFSENYLQVGQHGQKPLQYDHRFLAPVNTGVDSGLDLNGDKKTGGPNDAFGFGMFPGQYGMVVFSRFPIDKESVRTFRKFLWRDMPGSRPPLQPDTKQPYYSDEVMKIFRLSSKSHWDIPINVGDSRIHFLVCHPTPPVFDGPEDRNGCRNHDEIRFWSDYIDPKRSEYIYDDQGHRGGLKSGDHFVIAGDLNADPHDGDSLDRAARQLTEHALINSNNPPTSPGGPQQSTLHGKVNLQHNGPAAHDTSDFDDASAGNLRIDYVLSSKSLNIMQSGIFWPENDDPSFELVGASDHRLVWIDVTRSASCTANSCSPR